MKIPIWPASRPVFPLFVFLGTALSPADALADCAASSWPSAAGAPSSTGRACGAGPRHSTSAFERDLPAAASGSPVVGADGTIYVPTLDGTLVAQARDGQAHWVVPTGATGLRALVLDPQGPIYVGAEDGAVIALSPSGHELWQNTIGGAVVGLALLPEQGRLLAAGRSGHLYAFEAHSGLLAWSFDVGSPLTGRPAVQGNQAFVSTEDGQLVAIDGEGFVVWSVAEGALHPPMVASQGVVVGALAGALSVFDPIDGVLVSRRQVSGRMPVPPVERADGSLVVLTGEGALCAFPLDQPALCRPVGAAPSASPLVDARGNLFVVEGSRVRAFDPAGSVLFSYEAGEALNGGLALAGDGTLIAAGRRLHGLGGPEWRTLSVSAQRAGRAAVLADRTLEVERTVNVSGEIWGAPAIAADGTVYVASTTGLAAFARDGALRWRVQGDFRASPTIGPDGTLYVGAFDRVFRAIAPDGTVRWSSRTGSSLLGAAAVASTGGTVYATSYDGHLYAWDGVTGALVFRHASDARAPLRGSPAIGADGAVFFGSGDFFTSDGRLYAVEPDGRRRFAYETGASHVTGAPAVGPDGTVLVLDGRGLLHAIDERTGTRRWALDLGAEAAYAGVAIGADGTLYMGTTDGRLHAVTSSGRRRWSTSLGGRIESTPVVDASGTIFVATRDGRLHVLDQDGGVRDRLALGTSLAPTAAPAIDASGAIWVGTAAGVLHARGDGIEETSQPLRTDDGLELTFDPRSGRFVWAAFPGFGQALEAFMGVALFDPVSRARISNDAAPTSVERVGARGLVVRRAEGDFRTEERWTAGARSVSVEVTVEYTGTSAAEAVKACLEVPFDFVDAERPARWYPHLFESAAVPIVPAPSAVHETLLTKPMDIGVDAESDFHVKSSLDLNLNGINYLGGHEHGFAVALDPRRPAAYAARYRVLGDRGTFEGCAHLGLIGSHRTSPHRSSFGLELFHADDPQEGLRSAYEKLVDVHPDAFAPGAVSRLNGLIAGGTLQASGQSLEAIPVSAFWNGREDARYPGVEGLAYIWPNGHLERGMRLEACHPSEDGLGCGPAWGSFGGGTGRRSRSPNLGPSTHRLGFGGLSQMPSLGGAVHGQVAIGSDGTLYAATLPGRLVARAPDGTMTTLLNTVDGEELRGSPTVDDAGTVYFGGWRGNLYIVPRPGRGEARRIGAAGPILGAPAVASDGTVYFGSYGARLYAVPPGASEPAWVFSTQGAIRTSPAIGADGTIYVGAGDPWNPDGGLYAVRPDGTLRFRFQAPNAGHIYSTPSVTDDGLVVFGASDGTVHAVDGQSGQPVWSFPTGSRIEYSSPAVGLDGSIYIGAWDGRIYALWSDGTLQWTYALGTNADTSPVVGGDGRIYAASQGGRVVALEPDGRLLWQYQLPTRFSLNAGPIVGGNGTLYLAGEDGLLYLFETRTDWCTEDRAAHANLCLEIYRGHEDLTTPSPFAETGCDWLYQSCEGRGEGLVLGEGRLCDASGSGGFRGTFLNVRAQKVTDDTFPLRAITQMALSPALYRSIMRDAPDLVPGQVLSGGGLSEMSSLYRHGGHTCWFNGLSPEVGVDYVPSVPVNGEAPVYAPETFGELNLEIVKRALGLRGEDYVGRDTYNEPLVFGGVAVDVVGAYLRPDVTPETLARAKYPLAYQVTDGRAEVASLEPLAHESFLEALRASVPADAYIATNGFPVSGLLHRGVDSFIRELGLDDVELAFLGLDDAYTCNDLGRSPGTGSRGCRSQLRMVSQMRLAANDRPITLWTPFMRRSCRPSCPAYTEADLGYDLDRYLPLFTAMGIYIYPTRIDPIGDWDRFFERPFEAWEDGVKEPLRWHWRMVSMLTSAGWRPTAHARAPGQEDVLVERFGENFLTVYEAGAQPRTITLELEADALEVGPGSRARIRSFDGRVEVVSESALACSAGTCTLTLSLFPGRAAVLELLD